MDYSTQKYIFYCYNIEKLEALEGLSVKHNWLEI
jgi:hypothetical protein